MKKDEIIELLKEQIKELRDDNNRLLGQIDDLIKEVSSLKEALLQKGESLSKQQRLAKGLAKLVSNTSEQQQAPQPAMSEEERQKREAEKADKRKARMNNGAKRDICCTGTVRKASRVLRKCWCSARCGTAPAVRHLWPRSTTTLRRRA